jgi:hypothetical protein
MESLRSLLQKYMEQKNIFLTDYWNSGECTELLKNAMRQVMTEVKSKRLQMEMGQMNRRVLVLCIPTVMELSRRMQSSTFQESDPLPLSPGLMPTDTLYPDTVDMSPEEMSVDKDRVFMEKLQELEMARNLPVISVANANVSGAGPGVGDGNGNVKSIADVLLPQSLPASIPTSISTVFMPTPPRKGNELLVNSWQRNWLQFPQRNGYQWNGPLPQGIDLTSSRVAGLLLPRRFLKKSPYFVLQLEGAGNHSCQSIVVPDNTSHTECPWIVCRPMNDNLGYMKSMACPWTIKLYTANGMLLSIGKDGEQVTILSNPQRLQLSMEAIQDIQVDDQLWIFGPNGDIFLCEVSWIQKVEKPYWIGYRCDEPPKFQGEGNLFNFSQQWSIVLDIHKTVNGK